MNDRLFVGIDLPEGLKHDLAQLKRDIDGLRWQPPDSYHITLCFLGKSDVARLARIHDALAESLAGLKPFILAPAGLGMFAKSGRVRALWCGFAPCPEIAELQRVIVAVLAVRAGYEPENRPFTPHVTLAKTKGLPERKLAPVLREAGDLSLPAFTVNRIILYSSHPTPAGSHYEKEKIHEILPQGTHA